MNIKLFIVLLFVTINSPSFSQELLKQQIETALKEEKLAGAVWTIIDTSGQILTNVAGYKNIAKGELLTPTDRVHVGSITKTFLAVAILKLATEGRLKLDEPIKQYLPNLSIQNAWDNTHPITIRHLLDHTAGLEDVRFWQIFSKKANPDAPLRTAFDRDPSVLTVRTKPGSVFSYSNMGYTLVAMIIEAVTQQRYESYMETQILKPLGMKNSTFHFVSQEGKYADIALAMGHLDKGEPSPTLPMYLRPAGQFTTTAYDMGLYMKFLMSDGKIDNQPFIDPIFLAQMGRASTTDAFKNGLKTGYGLGLFQRDRYGLIGQVHGGNMATFNAMMCLFKTTNQAFFITLNMDNEDANYERFNELIVNEMKPIQNTDKPNIQDLKEGVEWAGYYLPVVSKMETVAILDVYSKYRKVSIEKGKVLVTPFLNKTTVLSPIGDNFFMADKRSIASHILYQNTDNQYFISDNSTTIKKVNGYQIFFFWLSLGLGLVGLIWLLLSSIFHIFKHKFKLKNQPIQWTTIALFMLILPIPFLFFQSFTALGDKTIGNVLIAIGTGFLPLGLLISALQFLRKKRYKNLDFIAILFALQFLFMLLIQGIIPFKLWV